MELVTVRIKLCNKSINSVCFFKQRKRRELKFVDICVRYAVWIANSAIIGRNSEPVVNCEFAINIRTYSAARIRLLFPNEIYNEYYLT